MVRIALGPFPGSSDDVIQRRNNVRRGCGVEGCLAQVTFWCITSNEWVCYQHGQLLLCEEWNAWDNSLEIEGPLQVYIVDRGIAMDQLFNEVDNAREVVLTEGANQKDADRYMKLIRCKAAATRSWGRFYREA